MTAQSSKMRSRPATNSRKPKRLKPPARPKAIKLPSPNNFGIQNHIGGLTRVNNEVAIPREIKKKLQEARSHIAQVVGWFNKHAEANKLPIRLSAKKVLRRLDDHDFRDYLSFFNRAETDNDGMVRETQIVTIVRVLCACLNEPNKCGLILGALQAGKTMTAICLQWLGPVTFLLTGLKVKPIYLITSQTSHEEQTKKELNRFLSWYGDIELVVASGATTTMIEYNMYLQFHLNPSLNNYRGVVVNEVTDDMGKASKFLHRRVHGRAIKEIGKLCRDARARDIEPVLILDEAQTGASDPEEKASGEVRQCVLRQIFDAVQEDVGEDIRFIAVTATAFELFHLTEKDRPHLWIVPQSLSRNYIGFNYFCGKVIDSEVGNITPPDILSMAQFGDAFDNTLMARDCFDFRIYALQYKHADDPEKIERMFQRWNNKHHYGKSYETYCAEFLKAARAMITKVFASDAAPIGFCIRACNNNDLTKQFIEDLALSPKKVEVLEFFNHVVDGKIESSGSVKNFLLAREHPELPYLIFVTNKARMGDAFPIEVKWFCDFTAKSSDMNALLQGLLGRACGYFKQSTVILSQNNTNLINLWMARQGGHIYKASRHVVTVDLERHSDMSQLHVTRAMAKDHPPIAKFWQRVDAEIIGRMLKQNVCKMTVATRARNTTRTAPLLKIAKDVGLFDYVERDDVRNALFPFVQPTASQPFKVVREDGFIEDHDKKSGQPVKLKYWTDRPGWCQFTFRHAAAARGGMMGRGTHTNDTKRDAVKDRVGGPNVRREMYLNPEITVEKTTATGRVFDDRKHPKTGKTNGIKDMQPGFFRAHMVSFPLNNPVPDLCEGTRTYPNNRSPFQRNMRIEDFEYREPYYVRQAEKQKAREEKRKQAGF